MVTKETPTSDAEKRLRLTDAMWEIAGCNCANSSQQLSSTELDLYFLHFEPAVILHQTSSREEVDRDICPKLFMADTRLDS